MSFYYTQCQVEILRCSLAMGPRYDLLIAVPYATFRPCRILVTLVECCTAKLVPALDRTPRGRYKIRCPSWFFMGSMQAGWTWIRIQ